MDPLVDLITSLFAPPSRRRDRTPKEEAARALAFYALPGLAVCGVVAGARGVVAIGVLPLLALGLTVAIGSRLGLDAARSCMLGLGSACICFVLNALMLLLSQPLF